MLLIKLNFLYDKIVRNIVLKKTVRKNNMIIKIISFSLPILSIKER